MTKRKEIMNLFKTKHKIQPKKTQNKSIKQASMNKQLKIQTFIHKKINKIQANKSKQ